MGSERTDGGRKPRVTDEEILDVFRRTSDPVLSTAEVAEQLPIKRRGTLTRLRDLYERDQLDSKQIGGRNTVWWLPGVEVGVTAGVSQGDEAPPAGERGRREGQEGREGGAAAPDVSGSEQEQVASDDVPLDEALRRYIEENELPPKTAHGRDAVMDVFRELRDRGMLETNELQDAVYPGYEDEWAGERAMWNAVDRYLENIPGIEKAGYGKWGYAGDDTVRETLEVDD